MNRWLRPPYSIRFLLVAQFLIVALVAIAIAAAALVFWRLPQAREEIRLGQLRLADMALQQLETSLDGTEAVLRALAPQLDAPNTGNRLETNLLLSRLAGNGELFSAIYGLDPKARIRNIGLTGNREALTREWAGNDLSGLDVIEQARQGQQLVWSDQFISPVQGRPVVGVALPINSGFAFAEVSVARLAEVVLKAGRLEGMLLLVLDRKGEVVAAPDMQDAANRINLGHLPLVQAVLEGRQSSGQFGYAGEQYFGTALRSKRLGWSVVMATPVHLSQAILYVTIKVTTVVLVLALLTGLWTARLLSLWIGRRVDRTIEHARAIAGGNYAPSLTSRTVLELAVLDDNLELMAKAIGRREAQLRAIIDLTPNLAVQIFDGQGRVLEWNPASVTMFGWSREEAVGKYLSELIMSAKHQESAVEAMREIERTGKPFGPAELRVKRRDGTPRVVLSTTFALPDDGGARRFVAMAIDITKNKEQEATIRENEQRFNTFFNASPIALSVRQKVDRQFIYVDVNPAWERLIGWNKDAVIGRHPLDLGLLDVTAPSQHESLIEALKKADVVVDELKLVRRDGSSFMAERSSGLAHMGAAELLITSLVDVTDKRQMQQELLALNTELEARIAQRTASLSQANEELRATMQDLDLARDRLIQTEKLASLGSLVAGIAHELNTPIGNGLMAVTSMQHQFQQFESKFSTGLRRSDVENLIEQARSGSDIAVRNLERAGELVRSFKQVSADQVSEQRRRFGLLEVVNENLLTLQPMLRSTTHQVKVAIDPTIELDSYPGAIGQVLSNLLQNAFVHGLEGRKDGVVAITAHCVADQLTMELADNGCGIPADRHKRIFDPFYTTKMGRGGSGLGLPIVRNIVTGVLGGQIDFTSEPGKGTTFRVTMPLTAPARTA
jgi:PAS domain S-box-containing protein